MTFFVGVTFFINRAYYDLSIISILENYSSINPTYNGSLWFLFPYMILFVVSSYLFKILDKHLACGLFIILFMFIFSNYILKKEAQKEISELPVIAELTMNFFKILFPFSLGYIAARYKTKSLYNEYIIKNRNWILSGLFLVLLSKLFISSYTLCYIYVIPIILFFHYLRYSNWIDTALCKLGRLSTYMWFTHAYFTYYIFHTYVYEVKYPVFIFIIVVMISYILSLFFEKINKIITA